MPFAVFWMRAHFVNMPSEILEAAKVDGASTWDLFGRIHVPLALIQDPTQRTMTAALGAFHGHYADVPDSRKAGR